MRQMWALVIPAQARLTPSRSQALMSRLQQTNLLALSR
jgi:hypothetical protein